jgi:hypothetical protein
MNLKFKIAGIVAVAAAGWALVPGATAQVTADALLDKLVAKGILKADEAEQLKIESTGNSGSGTQFKLASIVKSVEIYGDLRFRYEYRAAKLGPEAGGAYYDAANRWRYALRLGARGDLTDDFYYGIRFETSANPRSTWNSFGNASGGQGTLYGPFSKANNYSFFIGQAYLGWHPYSWVDLSIGRVPQPLYTTPMVWDSDFAPEGAVEKFKYTYGPVDYFATFAQYVYQDTTPSSYSAVEGGGTATAVLGPTPVNDAYLLAWQVGGTYHVDTNLSVKVAPVLYTYVGHGNQSSGFYGPFVGEGEGGFNFQPGASTSGVPGGFGVTTSLNQTGINNLFILEIPMQVDFKIGSLDARAFGDWAVNFEGDDRARAAYYGGRAIGGFFPGGLQLNQDQAMQFGLAVGNNVDLLYSAKPKKGTWEARAYFQHVEQYALDPNLLDSDFFEGRGNMQGLYAGFAYSLTDATIATVRYGLAERINRQLGTGGYNADLPLPNPIDRYQIVQVDLTWKF